MARTSTTRDNAPTGADAHPSGVERQHLPMGSFVAGTYRIEGLLGEGGGGVVYRAVHVELGRAFAVKVLRAGAEPDAAWRFVQEAKIASSLAHPNIVDVVHLGRDEAGRHFVVMDLLAGEDLQGRLQRVEGTGLPFEEAQALFAATLDGVAAAHEAGVVHRDLKPANIFLAERRGSVEVKVLDFGMSRSRDAEVHVTRTGELVGTPLYMAPEQSKQAGVDARSDVYSLGVVAYEMLAGRVPFPAETLYACVLSHALQAPPPLEELRADLPLPVVRVVHRCLAKDPADRFADARELRRAWSDAWASAATHREGALASGVWDKDEPVAQPPSTHRAGVVGPVGVLVVVGVAAMALAWSLGGFGSRPTAPQRAEPRVSVGTPTRPAGTEAAAVAEAPPQPPAANPLQQMIHSIPSGATVVGADGATLGVTPLLLPASPRPLPLELRLVGHNSASLEVSAAGPATVEVTLPRSTVRTTRRTREPTSLPALAPR